MFLVPLLRVIVMRSDKDMSGLPRFADASSETYRGSMGEVFDSFMMGARFLGSSETIGETFFQLAKTSTAPGAYILLGDEPSDDRIHYSDIPSPVFPIAIGRTNLMS